MFLKEGGAGGHMQHPFDLPDIKNGEDLRDFFEKAGEVVKKSQAVKIDGVNVSFKLISDEKDRKEFAVDRGSTKPIDIEGISMDRVGERFPEGHGMRPAIKTLLSIFNEALPKIEPELKKLGMWDNPTVFLNTEYVSETTNVTEYDHSFLAIHGVNQFYEKTNSRTGVERPGLERPAESKDPSVEVAYDPEVLQSLADKVQPFAEKYDFEVYTTIPTSFKKETEISFSDTLEAPFTVVFDEEDEITKPLGDWLEEVDNPRHIFIKRSDGKKIGALSKEVYTSILNGTPITSFIDDESDVKPAIAGAVFYHATRMLGNDILKALTSPMGDVTDHEGVVIRHKKFGQKPVKITGDFILGGMGTGFRESKEYDENFINEVLDVLLKEKEEKLDAIYLPGGFKPPHRGHWTMVQNAAESHPGVPVYIVSGKVPRDGITLDNAEKVWNIYIKESGLDNIELIKVDEPIVRTDAQGNPRINKDGAVSVSTNPWEWIKKNVPGNKNNIGIVYSEKDKNYDTLADAHLGGFENLTVTPIMVSACPDEDRGCALSATNFREALKQGEGFEAFIPEYAVGRADDILNILGGSEEEPAEEFSPNPLEEMLFSIIEEVILERAVKRPCKKKTKTKSGKRKSGNCAVISHETGKQKACYDNCGDANAVMNLEEEDLEEISGAGAAGGYGFPLGAKPRYFNSPRPKVKGIKIYTRTKK